MKKSKRGIASMIILILIILLVLVSLVLTWTVIIPQIKRLTTNIEIEKYTYKMNIDNVRLWYTGGADIIVKRGTGKGNVSGIRFIFYKTNGDTEKIVREYSPKELETMIYRFTPEEVNFPIDQISIIPMIGNRFGQEIFEDEMKIKRNWDKKRSYEIPSEDQLISWWNMGEDSTTALPDVMNNNHGRLVDNAKIVNKELILDGRNSYVDLGNKISLNLTGKPNFTITAWINPASIKNYDGILSSTKNDLPHSFRFSLGFTSTNNLRLKIGDGSPTPEEIIFNSDTIELNKWQFIALTFNITDSSTWEIKYYHDDSQKQTGIITKYLGTPTDPWKIGKNYEGNTFFNGKMKNIMIFNSTLDSSEINSLYNIFKD